MKYTKIIRVFGIAIILGLLLIALPAAAQTRSVTIDPTEGSIGTRVTVVGEGFNKSNPETGTEKYALIYFTSEEATTLDDIDSDVLDYEIVKDGIYLDENGEFQITFTVPDTLSDGADDEDVTSGTYYIYVNHYLSVSPPTVGTRIRAIAEFTVTAGKITLDTSEGPVGAEVAITGSEFISNETIAIAYDGAAVDIEGGDSETDSSGDFVSSILVPESTAGEHTIAVTVSGSEVEAVFTVEPEIILSPTSGTANTTVTVSGTGFGRRANAAIYFSGAGVQTETADSRGSFNTSFTVPTLDAGIYDVEAEDDDNNLDTAKFTVTVPPPPAPAPTPTPPPAPTPPPSPTTASISSTSGNVGTDVIIGGAGFEAGGTVIVKYDGEEVATATADSNGIFVAAFQVPVSKSGDHMVTASDGTNTEQFTFTMESDAPPVPPPLLPEMSVEVKPPITFDWEGVEDDSPPVTYTLQIATSQDFSSDSIVLAEEGLTKSEYTIADEETLAGQEAPYYWRVRAVDGASNESDWTGAGQFFVSKGFALAKWALYTLIGVGGLILFAVGYYLGRRTAYYY